MYVVTVGIDAVPVQANLGMISQSQKCRRDHSFKAVNRMNHEPSHVEGKAHNRPETPTACVKFFSAYIQLRYQSYLSKEVQTTHFAHNLWVIKYECRTAQMTQLITAAKPKS